MKIILEPVEIDMLIKSTGKLKFYFNLNWFDEQSRLTALGRAWVVLEHAQGLPEALLEDIQINGTDGPEENNPFSPA